MSESSTGGIAAWNFRVFFLLVLIWSNSRLPTLRLFPDLLLS